MCNNENINESIVSEGFVEVVKRAQNKDNTDVIRLTELEEIARSANRGKWSGTGSATRRTLLQEIENGQSLIVCAILYIFPFETHLLSFTVCIS